ncbi:hypothetical protein ACLKMY_36865 [Paraburkholderia mimosarum]|uniref:hypothetical protein n=1 Tax=Paraburkholderia mimosarum TaxID=312026 RepID=UPI000489F1FF|nr:hypothetical protein [Paraburkholderia mimosarum]
MDPNRAKVLTPVKFRHLLRVTDATSRFPERDTLILLLGVTCGMRVTEIARPEVSHVLTRSGARREEIALPGSITKGCLASNDRHGVALWTFMSRLPTAMTREDLASWVGKSFHYCSLLLTRTKCCQRPATLLRSQPAVAQH